MFVGDIKRVVDQVSRDKGIDRDILIRALEEALKSAAKKKFGNKIDIEVHFNDELGDIEVFQFKEVVEKITEPELQMSLEEGLKLDQECEIGDSLGIKMDTTSFGRIAAQSAKQVIIQKMKDAERDAIYTNFIDRKGEVIHGIVQRFEKGDIIVNLGQTEAVLPVREQVPREIYHRGDRIRCLILEVKYEGKGPQIVLSRTHNLFLINLFKTEVPEISEGIVTIMAASREPGSRSKIAVASTDSDIDPIGACVGMKGSRVQNVVQELKGEKIDIIPWHVDAAKFVCNALAPAVITRVIIDEDNKSMEVIVPDDSLSIAIGKRGQNVRLASRLTGWRLDVKSENKYKEALKKGYDALSSLPGVSPVIVDSLYEMGFESVEELAKASVNDLNQVDGLGEEEAESLIEAAQQYSKTIKIENEKNIRTKGVAGNGTSDSVLIKEFVEKVSENDTDNNISESEAVTDKKDSDMDKDKALNADNEEPEKIEDNEI
jgi:transcription termination/antitermination protein NusA